MPAAFPSWSPLPHRPLQALSENLWSLEGDLPDGALKRVMTIARTKEGQLIIHNGIAVNPETAAAIERLGTPEYLLVPNGWHRLDSFAYKQRYPGLKVLCPRAAMKAVQKVVSVSGSYNDFPPTENIVLKHLPGVKEREGFLEISSSDGRTLVFNDIIFNEPHFGGVEGFVMRLIGSTGGPKITTIARLGVISDKRALRAFLEGLAGLPELTRIIVSHGRMISENAGQVLRQIASTL